MPERELDGVPLDAGKDWEDWQAVGAPAVAMGTGDDCEPDPTGQWER